MLGRRSPNESYVKMCTRCSSGYVATDSGIACDSSSGIVLLAHNFYSSGPGTRNTHEYLKEILAPVGWCLIFNQNPVILLFDDAAPIFRYLDALRRDRDKNNNKH